MCYVLCGPPVCWVHWWIFTGGHAYLHVYKSCIVLILLYRHTVWRVNQHKYFFHHQQSQVQSMKCEGEDTRDSKHLNQSKMQKVHVLYMYNTCTVHVHLYTPVKMCTPCTQVATHVHAWYIHYDSVYCTCTLLCSVQMYSYYLWWLMLQEVMECVLSKLKQTAVVKQVAAGREFKVL